jgi:hypothetical protein
VRGCPCPAAAGFDAPVAGDRRTGGHGRDGRPGDCRTRDPNRPHAPDPGAAAARPGAVPARHRQPWLAPGRFPASEHGDTDVFRGIKLAPPARIHGRVAAASRLWADRRSLAGKLRIVQQPRLLSGRDDHGPGHPNSDRLFPWPTRGAARPYSPDRPVGGRLGIARSRQPESGRRVRGHQFRRRARGRASQSRQLRAAAPGRRGGPLWLDRPHSHALALLWQPPVETFLETLKH